MTARKRDSFQQNEEIIRLLKQMLALQLYKSDVTMDTIAKKLTVSKKTVVDILSGVKKTK